MTGEEVLTNVEGGVGSVTLNRPNSLKPNHNDLLATVLASWSMRAVHAWWLRAGERGLCAGGTWWPPTTVPARTGSRRGGSGATSLLNALIGGSPSPTWR